MEQSTLDQANKLKSDIATSKVVINKLEVDINTLTEVPEGKTFVAGREFVTESMRTKLLRIVGTMSDELLPVVIDFMIAKKVTKESDIINSEIEFGKL